MAREIPAHVLAEFPSIITRPKRRGSNPARASRAARVAAVPRRGRVEAVTAAAVDAGFDPRGHFVYLLFGADHARPIYVGMSRNVLARLGTHMGNPDRRHRIERVALIRCDSREDALALEARLIEDHQPELNFVGVVGSSLAREAAS